MTAVSQVLQGGDEIRTYRQLQQPGHAVGNLLRGATKHFLGPLIQTLARQFSSHSGLAEHIWADPEHHLPRRGFLQLFANLCAGFT